jgi:hypothetical protein
MRTILLDLSLRSTPLKCFATQSSICPKADGSARKSASPLGKSFFAALCRFA